MPVTESTSDNPLHDAFLEAAEQAGHTRVRDYNAPPHEGVSRYFFTIAKGERWSAARSFLWPALKRPNLTVLRRSTVLRIEVDGGRASGVVVTRGGVTETIAAGRVILCAGAIGSPHLLMLSGIGEAKHLRDLGVRVVADRPGVGGNLQDHLSIRVQHACRLPVSLHSLTRVDRASLAVARALLLKSGPAASMPIGSAIHFRSDPSLPEPDVQGFFTPSHSQATLRVPFLKAGVPGGDRHAYSLSFYVMRPESHGEIRLRDANPSSRPLIRPRYLSDPRDRAGAHRAIAKAREIFAQKAFDHYRGEELMPGEDVRSAEDIDRFIARTGGSAFHPTSSCKMGIATDTAAVVDENCNVYDVDCLKIADASVMPSIVSGNTNAATMMIAARCHELVRAGL